MTAPEEASVHAAGGVIVRDGPAGIEIAVVHRPRYDDWSLPKGKLEPGEGFAAAALREVEEETGLVCTIGEELSATSYLDRKGRLKLVRYWAMTPRAGEFAPNDEVDALEWLRPAAAVARLDYEHDRMLIAELPHPGAA